MLLFVKGQRYMMLKTMERYVNPVYLSVNARQWSPGWLEKIIKGDLSPSFSAKFSNVVQLVRQPVAKTWECLLELILVHHPWSVPIIGAKDILPVHDVLANACELAEVYDSLLAVKTLICLIMRLSGVQVPFHSAYWTSLTEITPYCLH